MSQAISKDLLAALFYKAQTDKKPDFQCFTDNNLLLYALFE